MAGGEDVGFSDGTALGTHHDLARRIDEIDVAREVRFVALDHLAQGIERNADPGGGQVIAGVIENLVIDKDRERVVFGGVQINVELVRRLHVADTEIPRIGRIIFINDLGDAFVVVVIPGFLRDQKTGEHAMFLADFVQVARHLVGVLLTIQKPIPDERIVCHH